MTKNDTEEIENEAEGLSPDLLESEENESAPEPLWADKAKIIRDGDRVYYLLGTAHVSRQSVKDVRGLIDEVQPDTVCVELCEARYQGLVDRDRWKKLNISEVIRDGKTLFLLANLALGAFQRRIGEKLGVEPGAEMMEAVRAAEDCGANLELIDRDVQATLKRTWANLSLWNKAQLMTVMMGSLLPGGEDPTEAQIEELKEHEKLPEMLTIFSQEMPQVKGPLIDERDRFMMSAIEEAPGEKVVAVVGAAHLAGMMDNQGQGADREALSEIPKPGTWSKALKWILPLLILAAFSVGYYRHQGESLDDMLFAWILPNSIFCALLTAIGGGHILSIITGFIASPITSMNPLLPAGVVVGLVEASLRKPTVEDAENINRDVQSLGGVYQNRFTRVLLVVAASTVGSAMGAWIGLGWLASFIA